MTSMVFRWRSWLGLAVALFLVYGALNLLIAIATPLTLQFGGAGASGFPPVMSGLTSIIGLWVLALVAFVAGLAGLSGTRDSTAAGAAHPTV